MICNCVQVKADCCVDEVDDKVVVCLIVSATNGFGWSSPRQIVEEVPVVFLTASRLSVELNPSWPEATTWTLLPPVPALVRGKEVRRRSR